MGVQTLPDSEDGIYQEILTADELQELENEFRPRLKNACYLDHSGATLYGKSQIDAVYSELQSNLFSNPHSRNPSSSITTDAIDYIRLRILHHFGTTGEDYSVIFTSGATSALKLLAESFRFNEGTFAYLEESHTSIVGMREVVAAGGAIKRQEDQIKKKENTKTPIRLEQHGGEEKEEERLGEEEEEEKVKSDSPTKVYCLAKATLEKLMDSECEEVGCSYCNLKPYHHFHEGPPALTCLDNNNGLEEEKKKDGGNGLLAYPAQCNFSGYKYPLDWIARVQRGHLDGINQIDPFYIQLHHMPLLRRRRNSRRRTKGDSRIVAESVEGKAEHNQSHCEAGGRNVLQLGTEDVEDEDEEKKGESATKLKFFAGKEKRGQKSLRSIKNECGNGNPVSHKNIAQPSSTFPTSVPSPPSAKDMEDEGEKTSNNHHGEKEEGKSENYPKRRRRELNWYVLLDAASFVATSRLDLSLYPADFIPISFYKMFGFPTGLGALIVRNRAIDVLEKCYFGGGTVNVQIPSESFHAKRHHLHERFEDGTIPFLSILALRHGFDAMNKLCRSLDTITTRTFRLARYCYESLSRMQYSNGQPVVLIYSDTKYESQKIQGPIVTFNLLRRDGTIIGYSEMEQMAYLHDVHLRTGCFCNVGACRRHLNYEPSDIRQHYEAGHVCGDLRDLIDGKPTGAIRVSLGYMTTQRDVDVILRMIYSCWVHPFQSVSQVEETEHHVSSFPQSIREGGGPSWKNWSWGRGWRRDEDNNYEETTGASHLARGNPRKLSRIFVYPVKSCAPFEVSKMWAIGNRGLLYDREWLIVNSSGVPLTQKREPRLSQLKPNIDTSNRRLVLAMLGFPDVSVPLDIKQHSNAFKADLCTSKVCGDSVAGLDCGEEVSDWLSTVFGRHGLKLIRMGADQWRKPRNAIDEISLANFSQFLLVSHGSLRRLAVELLDKKVSWNCCSNSDSESESSSFESQTTWPVAGSGGGEEGEEGEEDNEEESCGRGGTDQNGDQEQGLSGGASGRGGGGDGIARDDASTRMTRTTTTKVHQNQTKEHLQITKVVEELIERFRANFVITEYDDDDDAGGRREGGQNGNTTPPLQPYEEESWEDIQIGTIRFQSGGPCLRCATICTDQKTGQRSPEPYLTLSASRQGRANFGIHLYRRREDEGGEVEGEMKKTKPQFNSNGTNPRELTARGTWVSSSSISMPSSSSLSSSSSASVQTIRIGDAVYPTLPKVEEDQEGMGVPVVLYHKRPPPPSHRPRHHHNANVLHRNANGNPTATPENRKIIDSID